MRRVREERWERSEATAVLERSVENAERFGYGESNCVMFSAEMEGVVM